MNANIRRANYVSGIQQPQLYDPQNSYSNRNSRSIDAKPRWYYDLEIDKVPVTTPPAPKPAPAPQHIYVGQIVDGSLGYFVPSTPATRAKEDRTRLKHKLYDAYEEYQKNKDDLEAEKAVGRWILKLEIAYELKGHPMPTLAAKLWWNDMMDVYWRDSSTDWINYKKEEFYSFVNAPAAKNE